MTETVGTAEDLSSQLMSITGKRDEEKGLAARLLAHFHLIPQHARDRYLRLIEQKMQELNSLLTDLAKSIMGTLTTLWQKVTAMNGDYDEVAA